MQTMTNIMREQAAMTTSFGTLEGVPDEESWATRGVAVEIGMEKVIVKEGR